MKPTSLPKKGKSSNPQAKRERGGSRLVPIRAWAVITSDGDWQIYKTMDKAFDVSEITPKAMDPHVWMVEIRGIPEPTRPHPKGRSGK